MGAVPEFGKALLSEVGAPKTNNITTFTEVQLKDPDGKLSIPDGVAVVERPSKTWRCLFEVKTSDMPLKPEQVVRYLDMAKQHNFDAVVTISNQLTASPTHSPVSVSGKKTKKVALRHLSWWKVLTEAVVQHRFRGVADHDQAWILGELIAYLDHEASGAGGFRDMGDKWVAVRKGARNRTLNATDAGVRDVAERWGQLVQYVCLGLSQDLGRDVRVKGIKPVAARAKTLADDGKLTAAIYVPDCGGADHGRSRPVCAACDDQRVGGRAGAGWGAQADQVDSETAGRGTGRSERGCCVRQPERQKRDDDSC